MKSQAMMRYEARNVLADEPVMIYEPIYVSGRIVYEWRVAAKERARKYAELLFNAPGFAHLDADTRIKLINYRFLRGTSIRSDQLTIRKAAPARKGARR